MRHELVSTPNETPIFVAAHAAPGHPDIYNPVDNLIAAIGYIQRRYGLLLFVRRRNRDAPAGSSSLAKPSS